MNVKELKSVPNLLSLLRLVIVAVLWALALLDLSVYVGIGLLIAGLTDALDGFIARRRGWVTEYGSRLDSIADTSVVISVIFWILLLRPEIFLDHLVLIPLWIFIEASSIIVGWIKFRRIANLHLYSAKAAGVAGYVFVVLAFTFGYNEVLFYIAFVMLTVSSIEALVLQLFCSRVDEHMKSIIYAYREGRLS